MRRFWNWITDQKLTKVRKWQSTVLNSETYKGGNLRPIGGSDDELNREQRKGGSIADDHNERVGPSGSAEILEGFDYHPINFEKFFDESSVAIESALDRKNTLSPQSSRKITMRRNPSSEEASPTPSGERWQKHESKAQEGQKMPNVRVTIFPENNNVYDDDNDEYVRQSKRNEVPQVSVSFVDDSEVGPSGGDVEGCSKECSSEEDRSTTKGDEDPDKKKISPLELRRQSTIQIAQLLSGRRSSTTILPLTAAQIHLVRTIWRQVYITKGPTVIGSMLSHRLFFKSHKFKEQFMKCDTPKRFPNRDSFNKAHAKAIGELFDKVIEKLENLESMSDCLHAVGAAHARVGNVEISRKIWNTLAETFIDCTLEWGDKKSRTETTRKAWALIIAFVVEKIKDGHTHERRQLAQLRRLSWQKASQRTT